MATSDPRHQFGQASEMQAEQFLLAKGYRILDRNVRTPLGELDLVAEDQGVVVFVEVKGRATEAFGGALLAVDHRKRVKLTCRFDVVLVQGRPSDQGRIEHLQNAFDISEHGEF
jgi:putative endonuclease